MSEDFGGDASKAPLQKPSVDETYSKSPFGLNNPRLNRIFKKTSAVAMDLLANGALFGGFGKAEDRPGDFRVSAHDFRTTEIDLEREAKRRNKPPTQKM